MSCWPRFNLTASGRTNAKCDEWAGTFIFAVHFARASWLSRGGCHCYFLPSPPERGWWGRSSGEVQGVSAGWRRGSVIKQTRLRIQFYASTRKTGEDRLKKLAVCLNSLRDEWEEDALQRAFFLYVVTLLSSDVCTAPLLWST